MTDPAFCRALSAALASPYFRAPPDAEADGEYLAAWRAKESRAKALLEEAERAGDFDGMSDQAKALFYAGFRSMQAGSAPPLVEQNFDESKHPRGQAENAGQFGPGGGGGGASKPDEKKTGDAKPAAAAFAYPQGYKPPSPNSAPSEKLPPAAQPNLDAGGAKALDWYASDGYKALNAALYQGADLTWSKAGVEGVVASVMGGRGLGGRPKAVHERLQQAFAKAEPFAEPVAVTRGLSFPNDRAKDAYVARFEQAATSGGVVKLAGYQSTTVGGGTVGTFANSSVTLEIDAVHGLDVGPYSLYHHESELLLDHDSAFSVKKVERDHLGRVTIRLEQQLPAKKAGKQSLTEATMSDENDDLPQDDAASEPAAGKPTPEEAFRERVAGSAPPPDSVKVLTPEEAAAAGYTRHPKAKD